jgi:hypothetical protein
MMMKHRKLLQVLNILTLVAIIAVNALANVLPINGQTTGEVSAQYENLFTPAGYTFSIWSVVYLGLIAFVIYQSRGLFSRETQKKPVAAGLGFAFFINGMANVCWIFAWHYMQFNLTVILMAIILLSLIDINLRIRRWPAEIGRSKAYHWFVKVPFGLYFGWICVAAIANTAVYLIYVGWNGFGLSASIWTIVALMLGGMAGIWILIKLRSLAAVVAIAWGYTGVLVNLSSKHAQMHLQLVALVILLILIIAMVIMLKTKTRNGI